MAIERVQKNQKDEPQSQELLESVHLGNLMESALASYPNQGVTEATAGAWLEHWATLYRRMGRAKFEWALRECCLKCKFFPSPADIQEMGESHVTVEQYIALPAPSDPMSPEEYKKFMGSLKKKLGILTKKKAMPKGKRA